MKGGGVDVILQLVKKATGILDRDNVSSVRSTEVEPDDASTLDQLLKELLSITKDLSAQRVLTLSGADLMRAGVDLYNASRTAIRDLLQAEKTRTGKECPEKLSRYLVVVARFTSAKIMNLALDCSKGSVAPGGGDKKGGEFLDDCLDVLRSFARAGTLLLESAKVDCNNCQDYLAFGKEALSCAHQLWSLIGLSHLTTFKQGLELEEILDALWDSCFDRVRVLRCITEGTEGSAEEHRDIIVSFCELQMLAPYKLSSASAVLDLMVEVSDGYCQSGDHEHQAVFVEEAVRVCDSLESIGDETFEELATAFKQQALLNYLHSICAMGDYNRAEACYPLFPDHEDPKVLLMMTKLYVKKGLLDKARHYLRLLFQQDNLDKSIQGARILAQALSYSEDAMELYGELQRNYGDRAFEVNLDLACGLAFIEDKCQLAMGELKRVARIIAEAERNGQAIESRHAEQVRRTVFEAAQQSLNSNQHEVCLNWGDVGLAVAASAQEKAAYMRMMSYSSIQLANEDDALTWAEKAFACEPSKGSLFAMFQAILARPLGEDSRDKMTRIFDQLRTRDDFVIGDMLAYGKYASDAGPGKQDVVLQILDELCAMLKHDQDHPASLPKGIVLQNAAHLALNKCSKQASDSTKPQEMSYDSKFAEYANTLVEVSKLLPAEPEVSIGPASVFEWFYAWSFNIAKSTDNPRFFILAADLADRCDELFRDDSPLKQRSQQCLLAAVSSDMMNFEVLEKDQMRQLLQVIQRYEDVAADGKNESTDELVYLAKAEIAAKLRLFDANTDAMFEICKTKLRRNAKDFMEIGELVLYATKFDEASEVREKYRSLARMLFKYGLQVLLQSDSIDPATMCYLFRRLINLSESKSVAYEWLEQLVQLLDSIGINISEFDAEWFVGKSWNIGISFHRSDNTEEAQRFMKLSLSILERCGHLKAKMQHDLRAQYQSFLTMELPHPNRPTDAQSRWC